MVFCYDKLWDLAYSRHLNKTALRDEAGLTNSTLARLSKNETVSMDALARICDSLDCSLEEIVEYKKRVNNLNYVSLFSSAGVGCFGFKQEGFLGVATSELIERRLNVQKANDKVKYDNGYVLGDITQDETKEQLYNAIDYFKKEESVNEIDAVIFTAPCQGMSVANHKKNDGTIVKNSLVVEALEIVKKIQPKFFIAENVRAFMTTKCIDHDVEKKIKDAFVDWLSEDYVYESKIFNFKNFGANSSRTRTVVIGVRKDLSKSINIQSLYPSQEPEKNLFNVIGDLKSLQTMGEVDPKDIYHNFKKYRPDMRNWIKDLKPGESAFDNIDPLKRPHTVSKTGELIPNVNKNGDKYTRQRWNAVAPCVHTRNDILASQNTVHPTDDRVFSIRELMRMMNIPSSFRWTMESEETLNAMSLREKEIFLKTNEINIRQSIGEAVPTVIMQKIAKNIKDALNDIEKSQSKKNNNRLQVTG
ncbi:MULTISPECIES: DNA cytosine methyltransferase [Leuconostoc]|uniref:DNA cytosine methyltransferase n=1 Tax=Leuconostoc TaxID=1243 RepID=UPI00188853C7|nr:MULTISPECIES: DNA cytosine methyltransferase [Leuconostoc]QOY96903.1 DNA cytosine methyltransferase [Leuconostoc citreum]